VHAQVVVTLGEQGEARGGQRWGTAVPGSPGTGASQAAEGKRRVAVDPERRRQLGTGRGVVVRIPVEGPEQRVGVHHQGVGARPAPVGVPGGVRLAEADGGRRHVAEVSCAFHLPRVIPVSGSPLTGGPEHPRGAALAAVGPVAT